ncbi:MAG TPA: 5'-3' exonuclease [Gaiellaceae bacterium]|jgi:DNA polymerase-1
MAPRPLLAVDGDNLAHRAYHALPSSIKDGKGKPANMIVGFANMLIRAWEAEQPRTVFVAFDTITEPTYRHELLPGYQAGRDFPRDLTDQLDRLPDLVEALGFPWAKQAGYEADDFLAAAVDSEEERKGNALVLTNDRDLFQLASKRTTILHPKRGVSELQRVGPEEVRERYGVEPEQVPDFIALRGDPSDRIPGAPGVGPGRAAAIIKKHGSLEAALAEGGFPTIADKLREYLRIASLQHDASVPDLPDVEPSWERAGALTENWGLAGLSKRLRERA